LIINEPINITLAHLEFEDEKGASKVYANQACQR
jgi:hypothetical protein